jgi:hypothetical protein
VRVCYRLPALLQLLRLLGLRYHRSTAPSASHNERDASHGSGQLMGATAWGLATADAEHPLTRPAGAHVFVTDPDEAALRQSQVSLKAMITRDNTTPPPRPPPASPPSKVPVAVAITVCEDGPQVRRQYLSRVVRRVQRGSAPAARAAGCFLARASIMHWRWRGRFSREHERRGRDDGVLSRVVHAEAGGLDRSAVCLLSGNSADSTDERR